MKIVVRSTFERDIKKIKEPSLKQKIKKAIINIEQSENLAEIKSLKKLKGSSNAYRIRIGDYRIGFYFINQKIVLARFKNRKEVYNYFPE